MLNSAATLEEGGQTVDRAARQKDIPQRPGAAAMRFAYATGSRPLDGFTIKRGIGVGGFGEVYFAISDAGKEVALKRIQRNMDVEIRGVSQCLNLKHQNLVALYDIRYDDDDQGWVVMEYVAGESLKDATERHPTGMPLEEAIDGFRGIAAGVAYLHDHGIVHRDLKPGNIFFDENIVKIGDYGLSKFISCSRRSGQTESVGTFHYMAPEIGKGVYGKEIDIYALGIILFEMLTGRVPFDGESSQEIIMKHLTADPDLGPLPEPLQEVIQRALFKDPDKRYGRVADMLAALDEALVARAAAEPSTRPAVPPLRATQNAAIPPKDVLYIGDDQEADGIFLGPVKDVVSARPVVQSPHVAAPLSVSATRQESDRSNATLHTNHARAASAGEPIARAVRHGGNNVVSWWQHANFSTPIKALILVGGLVVLILNSEWMIPAGILLGSIYLIYFGIFSLVGALNRRSAQPRSETPADVAKTATLVSRRRRLTNSNWQEGARAGFRARPISERLSELSGSLLMSTLVAAITCLVMMMVGGKPLDESVYTWNFFTWLVLTSTAGAWTILTVTKLWEGREGESIRRRFAMLVSGLALGLFSFGSSQFLGVPLTQDLVVSSLPTLEVSQTMYDGSGAPKLPAFLVYFATMFAVVRWWVQADPLRTSRLSIWTTAICVLWAWILHMVWPFPQPWGFMLAATMSIAVQLSSPWMTVKERSQFRHQVMEA